MAIQKLKGFSPNEFGEYHPSGSLGKKLNLSLKNLVDNKRIPIVNPLSSFAEVINEISSKMYGATAVLKDEEIVGIITDGDIRRVIEKRKNIEDIKASEFMNKGNCQIAFVATNSISQGEQVSQLWPNLFREYKVLINIAHRTFAWGSDARGKANVHVVIIGLINESNESKKKRLYSYDDIEGDPTISFHKKISPYLIDASKLNNPNITVKISTKPINGFPILKCGSKPVDGGNYIFKDGEKDLFIIKEPLAQKFI